MKRILEEAKRLQEIAGIVRFGNETRPLETIPSLTNSDYSAMFSQGQNYPGEGADGHMYCPDCMCKQEFNEGKCMECSWAPLNEERHDVAMTMSNVQSIVQAATELLSKLQMAQESTELPAWIEDHIARADDLINQAAKGYYEEHNESEYEDQGEVRHYFREKLSNKQQQLDIDRDGEIEASDLKKLRAKK